ncbi:MAG: hypothetical protein M3Y69_02655 [Verrucomicrobiota bacterium]|nr:hypothetical protein [Verrucomicrobiota bacterium]
MKTGSKIVSILVILVALLRLVSCWTRADSHGKKLEFNGGELYYTSAVTEAETKKLGEYLVKESFFDGTKKTAQLNKSGSTYEFRVVAKPGVADNPKMIELFKTVAAELSTNVFNGSEVVVHLCDDSLKTVKVIPK